VPAGSWDALGTGTGMEGAVATSVRPYGPAWEGSSAEGFPGGCGSSWPRRALAPLEKSSARLWKMPQRWPRRCRGIPALRRGGEQRRCLCQPTSPLSRACQGAL